MLGLVLRMTSSWEWNDSRSRENFTCLSLSFDDIIFLFRLFGRALLSSLCSFVLNRSSQTHIDQVKINNKEAWHISLGDRQHKSHKFTIPGRSYANYYIIHFLVFFDYLITLLAHCLESASIWFFFLLSLLTNDSVHFEAFAWRETSDHSIKRIAINWSLIDRLEKLRWKQNSNFTAVRFATPI